MEVSHEYFQWAIAEDMHDPPPKPEGPEAKKRLKIAPDFCFFEDKDTPQRSEILIKLALMEVGQELRLPMTRVMFTNDNSRYWGWIKTVKVEYKCEFATTVDRVNQVMVIKRVSR